MSAYNCRAALLLQKELMKLTKLNLWGIDIDILDDNIFSWKLILSGLKETPWEGSKLEALIIFSEEYNFKPPHVSFQTIPVHPNVSSEDGTVCLDCLAEWDNRYSMSFVILSLQYLLSEPSLNSPLNENAARLAVVSPNHYKQIVLDCVLESKKERSIAVPDVTVPVLAKSISTKQLKEEVPSRPANRHKLSYEDYLWQWKTLGTTLPDMLEKSRSETRVQSDKVESSCKVSEDNLKSRVYPYGSFSLDKSKMRLQTEQLKATRMQLLKDIRGNKKGGIDLSIPRPVSPDETNDDFDVDNTEVNSLVSWSENLPVG